MANFDRERLRAVLTSAKIDATEKNIEELDCRLQTRKLEYWIQKKEIIGVAGPSKELLDLRDALKKWIHLCIGEVRSEFPLVLGKNDSDDTQYKENFGAIIGFWKSTIEATNLLDAKRSSASRHRPEVETDLFRQLYEDYCALSRQRGLSKNGPSIRFIKGCAKIR